MPTSLNKVQQKARKIRFILLDVDGVLTDGRIYYGTQGGEDVELKAFHAHDGFGISRAVKVGIPVGFITGRRSETVERRARELGVKDLFQGAENKLEAYERAKRRHRLKDEEIAYMGDDIPDLEVLHRVGLSGTTNAALSEVKRAVDFISTLGGGEGAVRQFIDLILLAQRKIG